MAPVVVPVYQHPSKPSFVDTLSKLSYVLQDTMFRSWESVMKKGRPFFVFIMIIPGGSKFFAFLMTKNEGW